jgi:hypothetical protein
MIAAPITIHIKGNGPTIPLSSNPNLNLNLNLNLNRNLNLNLKSKGLEK